EFISPRFLLRFYRMKNEDPGPKKAPNDLGNEKMIYTVPAPNCRTDSNKTHILKAARNCRTDPALAGSQSDRTART
ncbi:MAG: hypothetical protein AAFP19_27215, partial [Bacteroidota bacterium]